MTVAQLLLANNILEESKIAICPKKSKTNHGNQQLLMMALVQHQNLRNALFSEIILLSSCHKTLLQSCQRFSRNNRNFWNHVWIYYIEARFRSTFRDRRETFTYVLAILTPYLQKETNLWIWELICEDKFSSKIFIFTNGFYTIIHMLVLLLTFSASFFTSFQNFLYLSLSPLSELLSSTWSSPWLSFSLLSKSSTENKSSSNVAIL